MGKDEMGDANPMMRRDEVDVRYTGVSSAKIQDCCCRLPWIWMLQTLLAQGYRRIGKGGKSR